MTETSATPIESPAPSAPEASTPTAPARAPARAEQSVEQERGSAIEQAFARAQAKLGSAADTPPKQDSTASAPAAGQDGATAPVTQATATGASETAAKPGEAGTTGAPPADSTSHAPQDWPGELRQAFDALPNAEARAMVLRMQRDMQAGFTKATQQVADLRKRYQGLEESGVRPDELQGLLSARSLFQQNPRQALEHLASQAGIPVWFEAPTVGAEAPPEFETAAEMATWVQQQAERRVERLLEERSARERAEVERRERATRIEREFAEASGRLPDFATHQQAVVDAIVAAGGQLSPEQAYWTLRGPELLRTSARVAELEAKLAGFEAERAERQKRAAGALPGASAPTRRTNGEEAPMSPYERAAATAAKTLGLGA